MISDILEVFGLCLLFFIPLGSWMCQINITDEKSEWINKSEKLLKFHRDKCLWNNPDKNCKECFDEYCLYNKKHTNISIQDYNKEIEEFAKGRNNKRCQ